MYRSLFLIFLFSTIATAQQHCGYDFTSYIVLHIHEDGKKQNISGLKVTLIDSSGNEAVNTANKYSWKKKDEVLQFSENYPIDNNGSKLENKPVEVSTRWFFPFAKDVYLLSVTNEFPADMMKVKIDDPQRRFETTEVQLFAFNMYILCSTQAQQQAVQFGPRQNKPVDIVLQRKR
ncbi:MAG TPA: hypothetical protein VGB50_11360 [Flavobacterium sp.]|jgi:hypothetical protein